VVGRKDTELNIQTNHDMKLNHLKTFLFTILIFATLTLKAQTILFGLGGGGGTFAMTSAKAFNQTLIQLLPFKPVVKDNFPPYFFYKAEAIYCLPRDLAIGINVSTTSTGSRLSLADYSGKYTLDNIQKGLFPGIKIVYGNWQGYPNGINFSLEGGAAFSKMTVTEDLKVFDQSTLNNEEFTALGFYVQPGLCYFKNVIPQLKLSANLSYYYGFEKGYHLPGDKNQRLYNSSSQQPIKPQWDGLRLGITAYFVIIAKTKKQ